MELRRGQSSRGRLRQFSKIMETPSSLQWPSRELNALQLKKTCKQRKPRLR